MKRRAQEATASSFARYGSVFKVPSSTPLAETPDFKYWSDVTNFSIKGETEIGWCTVFPRVTVREIERHVRTPEILIPVDAPFILPVLREGDADDELQAFRVNVGEAIVIGDGVWHGACVPVGNKQSSYFVIFRRGTPQEDVVKRKIVPVEIEA